MMLRFAGIEKLAAREVVVPRYEERGDELHGHGADVEQADSDEHIQVIEPEPDGRQHGKDREFLLAAHAVLAHEDILHAQEVIEYDGYRERDGGGQKIANVEDAHKVDERQVFHGQG